MALLSKEFWEALFRPLSILAEGIKTDPRIAAETLVIIFFVIATLVLAIVLGSKNPWFGALGFVTFAGTAYLYLKQPSRTADRLASKYPQFASRGRQLPRDLFTLGDEEKKTVLSYLEGVTRNVSALLAIDRSDLRSNIFAPAKQRMLRIVEALHYNMKSEEELSVEIPIGHGCSGYCFEVKKPIIAILKQDWGKYSLNPKETAKLDRNLRWIVSTPIPDPTTKGNIIGVLNVDCLHQSKTEGELERIVPDLAYWAGLIAKRLIV